MLVNIAPVVQNAAESPLDIFSLTRVICRGSRHNIHKPPWNHNDFLGGFSRKHFNHFGID